MNSKRTIFNTHPIIFAITLIGLIASLIGIFAFISGKENIGEVFNHSESKTSNQQPVSYDSSQKSSKVNKKRLSSDVRVEIESGLFNSSVYTIYNGLKTEICSGQGLQDAILSPDQKKVLIIGNSEMAISDIDGSKYHSYYVNCYGTRLYNRELTNITFTSARKFRMNINLWPNEDVQLGEVKLDGQGLYEIAFDEYNYLSKVRRIIH